jgi:hypothetical protein
MAGWLMHDTRTGGLAVRNCLDRRLMQISPVLPGLCKLAFYDT